MIFRAPNFSKQHSDSLVRILGRELGNGWYAPPSHV